MTQPPPPPDELRLPVPERKRDAFLLAFYPVNEVNDLDEGLSFFVIDGQPYVPVGDSWLDDTNVVTNRTFEHLARGLQIHVEKDPAKLIEEGVPRLIFGTSWGCVDWNTREMEDGVNVCWMDDLANIALRARLIEYLRSNP